MSYRNAKVVNVSGETKRRLAALRGPHFGASEHEVVRTLLGIAENLVSRLRIGVDLQEEIPPACQSEGAQ